MTLQIYSHVKTLLGTMLLVASVTTALPVRAELSGDKPVLRVEVDCEGNFGVRVGGWDCASGTQEIVGATKSQIASLTVEASAPLNRANAATSSAYANFGRIGAVVSTSVNSASPAGSLQPHTPTDSSATARAEVSDFLTFNNTALTGTKGSFLMPVYLSGALYALSTGQALGASSRDSFSSSIDFRFESYDVATSQRTNKVGSRAQAFVNESGGFDYRGDAFPTRLDITVPFVWGQAIWMSMELVAEAESSAQAPGISSNDPLYRFPRSGSASADFSHTAALGGITRVVSGGQAVTDWSVSSASGADYRVNFATPVPEPATSMMLLGGLGLLAFLARRTRAAAM